VALDGAYRNARNRLDQARVRQRIDALMGTLRAQYQSGDWKAVVASGEELARLAPDQPDPGGMLAYARYQLDEADLAARYGRGMHLAEEGSWQAAADVFRGIEQQRPGYRDSSARLVDAEWHRDAALTPPRPDGGYSPARYVTTGEARRLRIEEGMAVWHGAPVTAAALSGDGRWVATAGTDSQVAVWSSQTGAQLRRWTLASLPLDVSISIDGRLLVVASGTNCWIYDTVAGGQVALLALRTRHQSLVRATQFDPQGRVLAAASDSGALECWSVGSWRSTARVASPVPGAVSRIRFHVSGGRLAVGTATGNLWLWDVAQKRTWPVRAVTSGGFVNDVAFSSRLVVGTHGGALAVVDASSEVLIRYEQLESSVETLDLSPDGEWLVAATAAHGIRAWDSAGVLRMETTSVGMLSRVRFSRNGRGLLTAGTDGYARLWRIIEM
jgi:hypothetical protein